MFNLLTLNSIFLSLFILDKIPRTFNYQNNSFIINNLITISIPKNKTHPPLTKHGAVPIFLF